MTLEEELDTFTERFAKEFGFRVSTRSIVSDVIGWRPLRFGLSPIVGMTHFRTCFYEQVNVIIEKADLAECLTHPHEYIREYRRYFENNPNWRKKYEN